MYCVVFLVFQKAYTEHLELANFFHYNISDKVDTLILPIIICLENRVTCQHRFIQIILYFQKKLTQDLQGGDLT